MKERFVPAAPLLVALLVASAAAPLGAQDSRAALLEQQRAERAKQVQPYEPSKIEKALLFVEEEDPLRKIAPYNGFFVQYGYTGKPVGSGIAFGGGYRHDLFGRRARLELEAGASFRKYQLLRADFSLPYLAGDRAELGVQASYRHDPQEDFYGLGGEALKADRVNFLYEAVDIEGRAVARPRRWLTLATRAGFLDPSIGRGTDSRFPSLEERFPAPAVPGLTAQPDFAYGGLSATVDTRDQPGNARSGGFYEVAWRQYSDRGLDRYGFRRTDVEFQQFFPIFDKKRVIAVRGAAVTTSPSGAGEVPFYFMPTLGGSTSVRSYADYRFRDRNMVVFNIEYRWEAFAGLDMALFSDWGKVAPKVSELDLTGMKHGYGIGFRFNTYKAVWLRIDIGAGGNEGIRYFFKFSKAY